MHNFDMYWSVMIEWMHLWTKNEVKICEKVLNNLGQLK